jgi:hypothetical protein
MIKLYEEFSKKPKVIIKYYKNDQKKLEEWFLDGGYHREDGPAYQWWFENGQKRIDQWWLNEYLHRKNGPAIQKWYKNGKKWSEEWWLNGKFHREDGPAYQHWSENGQKLSEKWSLNNKKYSREKWVKELKKIKSPHYEEQKMLLDVEKYNL